MASKVEKIRIDTIAYCELNLAWSPVKTDFPLKYFVYVYFRGDFSLSNLLAREKAFTFVCANNTSA